MVEIISYIIGNFQYVYPGIITLYLYHFIVGRKASKNDNFIIKAVVISYVYIILLNEITGKNVGEELQLQLLIMAIAVPIIANRVISSKMIKKLLKLFGIRTSIESTCLDNIESKVYNDNKAKSITKYIFKVCFSKLMSMFDLLRVLVDRIKTTCCYFNDVWQKIKSSEMIQEINSGIKDINKQYKDERGMAVRVYLDDIGIYYLGWLKLHESDKNENQEICLSHYITFRFNNDKRCYDKIKDNSKNDSGVSIK